ncbi:signal peptidase complex subunit 2 [Sporobolomyces salmoneus]|uniref:signal peptidase complex subunit 2 n=1 Tax=Sporobolomyces salmoneus TaxID=183962 RepID=UPI0031804AB1
MGKKSVTSKGKEPATTLPEDPEVEQLAANENAVQNEDRWLPQLEVIKVNPSSLVELKTALDDTVKEFFSLPRHNFQVSHQHEDVRLSLGWSSVVIALGTTYYAYKMDDFQGTKSWVALGVVLYVVLNTILALYVTYFEKNIIWVGKRRTIASRITTELLEISSIASSSPSNSTQSSWIPFPLSLLASSPPSPTAASSASSSDSTIPEQRYPLYTFTLNYTHSANANKSLLHQETLVLHKHVGEVFDSEGRIGRDRVEKWLKEGLERITSGNKEISR